jgi:hypothetical protein
MAREPAARPVPLSPLSTRRMGKIQSEEYTHRPRKTRGPADTQVTARESAAYPVPLSPRVDSHDKESVVYLAIVGLFVFWSPCQQDHIITTTHCFLLQVLRGSRFRKILRCPGRKMYGYHRLVPEGMPLSRFAFPYWIDAYNTPARSGCGLCRNCLVVYI